jgi:cytochrome c oxidase assembly protein subunit 15
LLAALTLTARFLATGQQRFGLLRAPGFGWAATGFVATILVGVSGSMAALGDTLFPASSLQAAFAQDFAASSPWLLRLRLVHPASALIAALFVLWLIARSRRIAALAAQRSPARLGNLVLFLLGLQFVLGIADVLLLAPAWMQLLHLLGADLYWVALVSLAAEVIWPNMPVSSPAAPTQTPTVAAA